MKPRVYWQAIAEGVVEAVTPTHISIRTQKGLTMVRRETGAGGHELATPMVGKRVVLSQQVFASGSRGKIIAEDTGA